MLNNFGHNQSGESYAPGIRRLALLLAVAISLALPLCSASGSRKSTAKDKASAADDQDKRKVAPQHLELTLAIADKDLPQADIFVGNTNGSIVNPRTIDISSLMASIPETIEAEKCRKNGSGAKYWILLAQASQKMERAVKAYAEAKKISFVCKRNKFFEIMRKQEAFKAKSDEEMIDAFDITDEIIAYFSVGAKKKQ